MMKNTKIISEFEIGEKFYMVIKNGDFYDVWCDLEVVQPILTSDDVVRYLSHVIHGIGYKRSG